MNTDDFQEMRRKLIEKRDAAALKLKEADEAIRGLELAWKLVGDGSSSIRNSKRKTDVLDAVEKTLPYFSKAFRVSDVIDLISNQNPEDEPLNRSSVSTALMKLVEDHRIELVERGAGRKGSRFKLTQGNLVDGLTG